MAPEEGAEETPLTPSDPGHQSRPPLWQGRPERRTSWRARGITFLVFLAAVAVVGVLLEYWFFSVPVGMVEVDVLSIQSAVPPDEGRPPSYQYVVRLPAGQHMLLTYPEQLKPGTRLLATETRSRLTGWIRLGPPYRVITADDN